MSENSRKTYDLVALENARTTQGWSYQHLAELASLPYDTVRELLSPSRHTQRKRQYQYFRIPANIKRIGIALRLKEDEYIKAATPPETKKEK